MDATKALSPAEKATAILAKFGDPTKLHDLDGFLRRWTHLHDKDRIGREADGLVVHALTEARELFYDKVEDVSYSEYMLRCYADLFAQVPALRLQRQSLNAIMEFVTNEYRFFALGTPLVEVFFRALGDLTIRFKAEFPQVQAEPFEALYATHARQALGAFFQKISDYDSKQLPPRGPLTSDRFKIIILTDSHGGGHIKQAQAIQQVLNGRFEFRMIHMEEAEERCDALQTQPLRYPDGTQITNPTLYARFTAHGDNDSATVLTTYNWHLRAEYPDLYADNTQADIIQQIRGWQPDLLIINLPHLILNLSPLAYRTNTPALVLQCDYDFHHPCQVLIKQQRELPVPLRLVHFGVPTDHPEFLPDGFSQSDPAIFPTGFPVACTFKEETDVTVLDGLRNKYGIREGAQVVKISRGLLGVTEHFTRCIEDYVKSPETMDDPVDFIVICGKNTEAPPILTELTRDLPKPGKNLRFIVRGLTPSHEVSEILQISKAVDEKAGGSTTQEFLEMAASNPEGSVKRAIAVPEYVWERPNSTHIQRAGLGKEYDPRWDGRPDRLKLLKELLADKERRKPPVINWTEALPKAIVDIVFNHRQQEEKIHGNGTC